MTFSRHSLVLGIVVFALVACGGQEAEPTPPRSDDPMPLSVGNRWEFDIHFLQGGTRETRQVVSAEPAPGGLTRYTVRSDRHADAVTVLERSATQLSLIPASNAFSYEQTVGSRILLKLPLRVGDRWFQVDRVFQYDFDGDGSLDTVAVRAESTVEVRETHLLRTGISYDAFLVVSFETITVQDPRAPGGERTQSVRTRAWYAPGVGLVDYEEWIQPMGGVSPHLRAETLLTYSLSPS